uniref:Uncharacterized protein n=1 Tax=Erpetoichthys calabaricus TaxID=27687 RepID=A0A8C4TDQ4_ERPCA
MIHIITGQIKNFNCLKTKSYYVYYLQLHSVLQYVEFNIDSNHCLFGCFCPCCLAAQVAHAFGECFILGCMPCAHCALRTGMRERYTIPGSLINDCCIMTFCSSCAICQMQREIKIRTMLIIR